MSAKRLLVPGTAGCKLLQDGRDIGWPAQLYLEAALAGRSLLPRLPFVDDARAIVSMLSMEYGNDGWPPTKSTLDVGRSMTAGAKLDLAYNLAGDFACFPYDWRGDIRASARQLLDRLSADRPANGRWKLLAHSQGGLVVIVASKLYARANGDRSTAFSDLVSHVALLGVPLMGTVNAAAALAFGENLGGAFKSEFVEVARTWPALYQMLPAWGGSVRDEQGQDLGTCLDDQAWSGAGLSGSLLQRARATREEFLDSPLSRMARVKVRITMSRAHPTHNHVVCSGGAVTLGAQMDPGDTLVPYETTRAWLSKYERSFCHGIGSQADTAVHSMLADDPTIWTSLTEFFDA